jgi:hypothetical protein
VCGGIYENRRMKSLEIVLRREKGRRRRTMEGVNSTKIYCKHICKYQNVSPYAMIIC